MIASHLMSTQPHGRFWRIWSAMAIHAGARVHQTGCNGCIGIGQAPATEKISLRTVPRNFPGRSGTREDKVYLVSPETAAASALAGVITDPRDLDMPYPRIADTNQPLLNHQMLIPPLSSEEASRIILEKGPNIASLPELEALLDELQLPVLLKVGDNVSTDEIMPAGARALPFRSNIPKIAEFAFDMLDRTYWQRAKALDGTNGHAVVGGSNYGQDPAASMPLWRPVTLDFVSFLPEGLPGSMGRIW
jgi:aconitate hydratase